MTTIHCPRCGHGVAVPSPSGAQIDLSGRPVQDEPVTEYIDEKECARRITLRPKTLKALRLRGAGPPWLRIGAKRIAYRWSDVERWIEENSR